MLALGGGALSELAVRGGLSFPSSHSDVGCALQVKILRPESYWFNDTGKVVSVDQVRRRCPVFIVFALRIQRG